MQTRKLLEYVGTNLTDRGMCLRLFLTVFIYILYKPEKKNIVFFDTVSPGLALGLQRQSARQLPGDHVARRLHPASLPGRDRPG